MPTPAAVLLDYFLLNPLRYFSLIKFLPTKLLFSNYADNANSLDGRADFDKTALGKSDPSKVPDFKLTESYQFLAFFKLVFFSVEPVKFTSLLNAI